MNGAGTGVLIVFLVLIIPSLGGIASATSSEPQILHDPAGDVSAFLVTPVKPITIPWIASAAKDSVDILSVNLAQTSSRAILELNLRDLSSFSNQRNGTMTDSWRYRAWYKSADYTYLFELSFDGTVPVEERRTEGFTELHRNRTEERAESAGFIGWTAQPEDNKFVWVLPLTRANFPSDEMREFKIIAYHNTGQPTGSYEFPQPNVESDAVEGKFEVIVPTTDDSPAEGRLGPETSVANGDIDGVARTPGPALLVALAVPLGVALFAHPRRQP